MSHRTGQPSDDSFDKEHILRQVEWITANIGEDEATRLLPCLENTFSEFQKAVKHCEDGEDSESQEEALKGFRRVIELNNHPYLFTSIFIVQSAIRGRDILRITNRHSDCLNWLLDTLSVLEIHQRELRYVDDWAELYQLVMEECNQDTGKRLVLRIENVRKCAHESKPRDIFSEGMATLALSRFAMLENDLDKARSLFDKADSLLTVSHDKLVWALRCCVLAEIGANSGQFVEATDAAIEAEEIYRRRGRTSYALGVARGQGDIFFEWSVWEKAGMAYLRAIRLGDELYRAGLMLRDKEDRLKTMGQLCKRAAFSFARAKRLNEAAVCLEFGRARGLGDALARDSADLERVKEKNPIAFIRFTNAAKALQEYENPRNPKQHSSLQETVQKERDNLREALEEIRKIDGYADFLGEPTFTDIITAVESAFPLVYLVTIELGSFALLIYRDQEDADRLQLEAIWCEGFTYDQVREWLFAYQGTSELWLTAIEIFDSKGEDAFKRTLDKVTRALWGLMGPVVERLIKLQLVSKTDRSTKYRIESVSITANTKEPQLNAVLIPCGHLALLPLHAAWTDDGASRRYALDDIIFSFAPSAIALAHARKNATLCKKYESFMGIPDLTGSLKNSKKEIENISLFYPVIIPSPGTKKDIVERLPYVNVTHFACHGVADFADGTKSFLIVSSSDSVKEQLTVADIQIAYHKDVNRADQQLAVLSACVSGVVSMELPDEAIGLPAAFLKAGFTAVVSSLWLVHDKSTSLLMQRFHENWKTKGLALYEALHEAQQWLRTETQFSDLWYWAPFYCTGVNLEGQER